jgi:hypothetical protein
MHSGPPATAFRHLVLGLPSPPSLAKGATGLAIPWLAGAPPLLKPSVRCARRREGLLATLKAPKEGGAGARAGGLVLLVL